MKANYERIGYKSKSWLSKFLKTYQKWLIIFGLVALVAFITGIMTAVKISDLEVGDLPSKAIRILFDNPKNNWGYFLQQLLSLFYVVILVIFCNFHPCMVILDIILILYHFYCFGFCFIGIILLYTVAGFFNMILFIFPFLLLYSFIILLLVCICYKRCLIIKKYGRACSMECSNGETNWIIVILLALLLFLLLIQTLILPIVSVTIIV